MARGHEKHEPINVASHDALKLFGNDAVMSARVVTVVGVFSEINEGLSRSDPRPLFLQGLQ